MNLSSLSQEELRNELRAALLDSLEKLRALHEQLAAAAPPRIREEIRAVATTHVHRIIDGLLEIAPPLASENRVASNLLVQVVTDLGCVVWAYGYDHAGQRGGVNHGTANVDMLRLSHDAVALAYGKIEFELRCANDAAGMPDRARAAGQVDDEISRP